MTREEIRAEAAYRWNRTSDSPDAQAVNLHVLATLEVADELAGINAFLARLESAATIALSAIFETAEHAMNVKGTPEA